VRDASPRDDPGAFAEIIDTWLPLTYALNAVNRSMGKDDLYPFVLSPVVLAKLEFVHDLVHPRVSGTPLATGPARLT